MSDKVLEFFYGQFAALVMFFAVPAGWYIFWKWTAANEGRPEIYYIPAYKCFRFVIRNLPRRITLSDLKTRAFLRGKILPVKGSGVSTYADVALVNQHDFFLFPGNDQVLISFRVRARKNGGLVFVVTDKWGNEGESHAVDKNSVLIADYIGSVTNRFNFDIKLKKRAEVDYESMLKLAKVAKEQRVGEVCVHVPRIRDAS